MSMRSKHTKVAIVNFLHVITPGREGKPLNSDPPAPMITDSTLDDCSGAVRPSAATDARSWARVLAPYREPNDARSIVEIAITLGPLVALWALAWMTYHPLPRPTARGARNAGFGVSFHSASSAAATQTRRPRRVVKPIHAAWASLSRRPRRRSFDGREICR